MKKRFLSSMLIFLTGIALINCLVANEEVEVILPKETIKLSLPIEIEDAAMYRDGGSTSITLRDSNGKTFDFVLLNPGAFYYDENPKPWHIYIGNINQPNPEENKIPIGGMEEKSILNLLEKLLAEKLSKEEQIELSEKLDYVEKKWSAETAQSVSREELNLGLVMGVINVLKNRQNSPAPK